MRRCRKLGASMSAGLLVLALCAGCSGSKFNAGEASDGSAATTGGVTADEVREEQRRRAEHAVKYQQQARPWSAGAEQGTPQGAPPSNQ